MEVTALVGSAGIVFLQPVHWGGQITPEHGQGQGLQKEQCLGGNTHPEMEQEREFGEEWGDVASPWKQGCFVSVNWRGLTYFSYRGDLSHLYPSPRLLVHMKTSQSPSPQDSTWPKSLGENKKEKH